MSGYFVNLKKSVLRPGQILKFLGIIVNSRDAKFYVPQDKFQKLMLIIYQALENKFIPFKLLEKCVGKCTSMSIAVPAAKLYTRGQYAALAEILESMVILK